MSPRLSRFVLVGALGFVVQMTVAATLLAAGVVPLLATLLAIEAAIVSNHAWHRHWAWRDRSHLHPWVVTLVRAHFGSGGTSLLVGLVTVALLTGVVSPLAAQVVAVALSAVANFWIADRWIFAPVRTLTFFVLLAAGIPADARADGPTAAAVRSWHRYSAALEQARAAELTRGVVAWATDDDRQGTRTLAALRRGEVVVTRRDLGGIDIDDATLEHWQGSVLLRGVSLDDVSRRLRHPEQFPQPSDVLELQVTARSDAGHDLYLRLTRSMLVTATYDTWHRVRHRLVSATRLDSTSTATRIDELDDAGKPSERRLAVADSRGFLWRMQSFWRFTAVPEGVVISCESITLSRAVPFGLGLMARPIITRVARESMTTAVRAWQRGWPRVRQRS